MKVYTNYIIYTHKLTSIKIENSKDFVLEVVIKKIIYKYSDMSFYFIQYQVHHNYLFLYCIYIYAQDNYI